MTKMVYRVFVLMIVAGPLAFAKGAYLPIQNLYAKADVVCIGSIVEVDTSRRPLATVHVIQTWKGLKQESLRFRAYPTWTCDSSSAVLGEVALLMLEKSPDNILGLVNSGEGRIPLLKEGAIYYTQVREFDFLWRGQETPLSAFEKLSVFRVMRLPELKQFLQSGEYK